MTRINWKEEEMKSLATLILSADDYSSMMQKINGLRMGIANKYKEIPEEKLSALNKIRRIDAWKNLMDVYK